jgi:hypothetical protein
MQPLRGEQSWVALGNRAVPKPEIRNPKSKTNPKSKGQRLKTPQGSAGFGFLPFSAIWICFGFRVSSQVLAPLFRIPGTRNFAVANFRPPADLPNIAKSP